MNLKNICNELDVNLYAYRAELMKNLALLDEEIERRRQEALHEVQVTKLGPKHFIFSHPVFGEFEAKNVAYAGRYRVWRRVPGVRGMKRGEVVIGEYYGGITGIRSAISKGQMTGETK